MHLGWRLNGKSVALSREQLQAQKGIQIGREGAGKEQCEEQPEAGLGEIVMDLVFLLRSLV